MRVLFQTTSRSANSNPLWNPDGTKYFRPWSFESACRLGNSSMGKHFLYFLLAKVYRFDFVWPRFESIVKITVHGPRRISSVVCDLSKICWPDLPDSRKYITIRANFTPLLRLEGLASFESLELGEFAQFGLISWARYAWYFCSPSLSSIDEIHAKSTRDCKSSPGTNSCLWGSDWLFLGSSRTRSGLLHSDSSEEKEDRLTVFLSPIRFLSRVSTALMFGARCDDSTLGALNIPRRSSARAMNSRIGR